MTEKAETFDGGCACGTVRYRMASKPMIVHCCHCYWCQRETGASYAFNAMIEADRVTLLQGEPVSVVTPSNSGKGQTFARCPECHIAVWSNYGGAGDKIHFVRVGTLDPGHGLSPDMQIFTASKQPWVVLPEGQPVFEEYYDKKQHWPADSLERIRRVYSDGAVSKPQ